MYFFILINKYLKMYDKNQDFQNLYTLLYYLSKIPYFTDNNTYKIKEIIENIEEEVNNDKIKNDNISNIINYSLRVLSANSFEDIKNISDNINSEDIYNPKIIDFFDDSEKYYKDLLNELFFKIKNLKEKPTIFLHNQKKNYWLCIIKLIEILINQNNIDNSIMKIIFYFIVKLLDERLDFLIEEDFISNNLYTLLDEIFSKEKIILLYPEIAYLLNDDEKIYNNFLTEEHEENFYNMLVCDLEEYQSKEFKQDTIYKNLKDYKYKNFFISIIIEYLLSNYKLQMPNTILNYNFYKDKKFEKSSFNIFYNLYLKTLEESEYELIDLNIERKTSKILNKKIYNYMEDILNNQDFLILIEKIMKSKVMDEAYKEIEKLDKMDKVKSNIKDYNIYNYYLNFIKYLREKLEKKNIFILMKISQAFRGVCFRFLKIIINTEDISFININNKNEEEINELLRAYLIFVIIHEFNHFLKRMSNVDIDKEIDITPIEDEDGKELIKLLFNHYILNRKIIYSQAKYILDIKNWENKSLNEFRNDYLNVKTETKDNSILYLDISEKSDICYYGFIGPEK